MEGDRDPLEIQFPRVEGYRVELPDTRLTAEFSEDSLLELTPNLVGATITRNEGLIGEGIDLNVKHLEDVRESTVLFHLTRHLLYNQYRDHGEEPKMHLFGQLKRITRQWMKGYLRCTGGTYPAQVIYQEIADMALRATLRRWEKDGLGGLWEASGRGAKPRWHPADLDYLTDCLDQETLTYSSVQLAQKLNQDRSVNLSSDRLRRFDLKYLDEAGFCLWSPVSYIYSRIGEQKRMEQTPTRHGRRISILGLWQPEQGFEYALSQGGFKGQSYIEVMDWVAQKAADTLRETGQITVVVQDNGSPYL